MSDLIDLLTRFGLTRVEPAEYGSPGTREFWVETHDDGSASVTLGAGVDGYGFFFCEFAFDAAGNYLSHGCLE